MIKKAFITAVSLVLFTAGIAFADLATNYVINGSFENPVVIDSKGWHQYESDVPGWDKQGNPLIEIQTNKAIGYSAYEGNQYLELDSNNNSTVRQCIHLNEAGEYDLSFWYSARPDTSGKPLNTNDFKVYFDKEEIFSATNLDLSKTWQLFTAKVTASNENPWLVFKGAGASDSYGAFIDAVSLTKTQTTPTPIPAAIWIFGTGAVSLLGLRRRKKA